MSNSRQSATTAFSARLTDAEWAVLQSLIPANRPGGRPPKYARRAVLDAILYVVRRGSRATYDARGRTLTTVENYVDGVPSNLDDKTTEYAYGPAGMTTLTARLAGGGGQTTQWVYGVTAATGSGLDSNDAKGATRWPDPATGLASASQQETVTVNALGQPLTGIDRNGTTHALSYDVLGRVTDDAVTLLGVNVDGAVRRVHTDYDGQGNAYLMTNYSAATGGTVVSQVRRAFNGLGQLTAEYQAHGAAVDTATTPKVQYAYSALDAANRSRPVSVTYPNGRVVVSDYGTAGQLNDRISRLNALKDGATTLEAYAYLGLGTVVTRSHPQPGIDLTYVKRAGEASGDAGDPYTGMDRFGRLADQRWVVAASGVAADRFGYTLDRSGNRLTKSNGVNAAFGEAYTYDGLNQLASFARGAHTQAWDYDSLGNWNGVTTDGTTQTRTANAQNEITAVSGAVTPTYDASGNMTGDETGRQFVYDAWNRLKVVKSAGGVVLETLGYDAINRRITSTAAGAITDLYHSAGWQVLEERVGGVAKASYVWSPVYVDALVSRDRDADGGSANGLEERLYALADANYNVTALVSVAGVVVERYAYDPFGKASVLDAGFAAKAGGTGYGWVVLFQGLRRDGMSGLDYARNRDYSATLGRWVTMDPIGFSAGDVNVYRFEGNGSVNHIDPSGLDFLDDSKMICNYVVRNPFSACWQGAQGVGHGANQMFVQPVYRTGQVTVDVVGLDFVEGYQPVNPHVIGYMNGSRTLGGTGASIILDATSVIPAATAARATVASGRLVAARVLSQRVTASARGEADIARLVLSKRAGGAAGVLEDTSGVIFNGGRSQAIRPPGLVPDPPISVNLGCAEAMTTQAAGLARLNGSYSAVALVGGKRHGELLRACDKCYPAMVRAGVNDAVRVVEMPWITQFTPLLTPTPWVWTGSRVIVNDAQEGIILHYTP